MALEKHEKFIAFCLLGASLVGLAVMVYLKPPSPAVTENGVAMAMLNTIVGALTLAFGGATQSLFKISNSDKKEIGEATATAIQNGPPMETRVVNEESEPVPTETKDTNVELPDYAR